MGDNLGEDQEVTSKKVRLYAADIFLLYYIIVVWI